MFENHPEFLVGQHKWPKKLPCRNAPTILNALAHTVEFMPLAPLRFEALPINRPPQVHVFFDN